MFDTKLGPGHAPPEIVKALRRIDADAELVHLGEEGGKQVWWLGVRAPNPRAQESLDSILEDKAPTAVSLEDPLERARATERLGKELMMRQVMARGFKPIALYSTDGAPGWDIVEDFRIRDHKWRNMTQRQIEKELADYASIEERDRPRVQRFGELAREAAGEAFRFVFKKARSFTRRANPHWR